MNRRRASTLAEMIIAMAIVSIMSVMVISFTLLFNGLSQVGIQRYRLTQSERSAADALRDFVSYFDSEDCYFNVTDGGFTIKVMKSDGQETEYDFHYDEENKLLIYRCPDKTAEYPLKTVKTAEYPLEFVTRLYFNIRSSEVSDKQLIYCTCSYEMPATNALGFESGTHAIVVSTHSDQSQEAQDEEKK